MNLDDRYYQQLYAGVLGKIIGVYIGRPFEGWSHQDIVARFGEINRFVHAQLGMPLIVSDDDISGTFLFAKALADHDFRADFCARHLGQSWLDNLIEGKTILWWGGYGQSTEHTAWLNLKQGIEAPDSGSQAVNGKTVAEQIGAQIFIDGWAMLNPGRPDQAVAMAREAARVSHDGEAVHAACLLAAMEAQAFVERDLQRLLDVGLSHIPADSAVARVIADVRAWHEAEPHDWRAAFARLEASYGYDKYDGTCHVIPNHGLIILSLLYGGDSFHESMKIVNTLGWDTDCNAANVGCLNGIRLGLAALDDGYDWRGPIADRFFLPSANGQDHIFDAVQQTDQLFAMACRLHSGSSPAPKPRFHFGLPGAVQGFSVLTGPDLAPGAQLDNRQGALAIAYRALVQGVPLRVGTATHTPKECRVNASSYHIVGSPTLYPGQTVAAVLSLAADAKGPVVARLFIDSYDTQLAVETHLGEPHTLAPGNETLLRWQLPRLDQRMVAQVGIQLDAGQAGAQSGTLLLHTLDWQGTPTQTIGLDTLPVTELWASSWINTMDHAIQFDNQAIYRLVNNDAGDPGLFVYGSNQWRDYRLRLALAPQTKHDFGPVLRYQGLTRYYRVVLTRDDRLQLVRQLFDQCEILADIPFSWRPHQVYDFSVEVAGAEFRVAIDDESLLHVKDPQAPAVLQSGGAGFYNALGPVHFTRMAVEALTGPQ